jgi:hypothetical protein
METTIMNTIQFKEWTCVLELGLYHGTGQAAIMLNDAEDGSPVARATIHMPGLALPPEVVCIKDYSENEGMRQALIDAGIIEPEILTYIPSGYVTIPVVKLKDEILEKVNKIRSTYKN